jgi:hypothetical protein
VQLRELLISRTPYVVEVAALHVCVECNSLAASSR